MNDITSSRCRTFEFSRYWQLLKSDLRLNSPKYIRIAIAGIGCFLTVAILVSVFAIKDINELDRLSFVQSIPSSIHNHISYYYVASFFITAVGVTVLGSLTFVSMQSKSGRISTLMMPASMLEKFAVHFTIFFLGGFLLIAVGFYIGILEMLLTFADFDDLFVRINLHSDITYYKFLLFNVMPFLLGNAFYTLGSAIWPRSSWIKTWVAQQILSVLLINLIALGAFSCIGVLFRNLCYYIENGSDLGSYVYWSVVLLQAIVIILLWVCTWWRFRTTQIVQRFMKK